jgi:hypothetical protein
MSFFQRHVPELMCVKVGGQSFLKITIYLKIYYAVFLKKITQKHISIYV